MEYQETQEKIFEYLSGNYIFSSLIQLTDSDLKYIINKLENFKLNTDKSAIREKLSGRGSVYKCKFEVFGKSVIKPYLRGGVYSRINPDKYISLGSLISSKNTYRAKKELLMLEYLRSLSVIVPKPIMSIKTKGLFHRNWLIMEDLDEKSSLVSISLSEPEQLSSYMEEVCDKVSILIENRVCHVDLHPGNVILSKDNKLYIIDFDKSYFYKGCKNKLRDYYLCRWRRAVIKHNLPSELSEYFCMGLRKNFNKVQSKPVADWS